ncbi:hypothetical protein [Chryseobacterium sp. 18068]|uniref:hypothetical protein n=1 Tax=Chryseobacterium sp. 18068 TaxID=2681414 RepID=UPI00135C35A2|nr:hypothetical protein [Chryseobacterium sp. 18068]
MDKILLSHRANINKQYATGKDVYIYEDHRTILNILFAKKFNTEVQFPVNIILFDNHDDGCELDKSILKIITKFNKNEPSLRDFWSFTEFDLSGMDDDWVKAGMELNLIKNVFLFNSTESSIYFVEKYKTKNFGEKKIYNLGNIWDSISHRGYFNDVIKRNDYGELWDDFGWKYTKKEGVFTFSPDTKFIVDFDLDCFSTEILDKRMAIPQEILYEKFISRYRRDYHYFYSSQDFVKELISKSEFSTICFENQFCGGFNESFKIFNYINELFFDSKIN